MKFQSQHSVIMVAFFVAVLAMVLAFAPTAFAHHSFAMFDRTKEIELVGVVKEFQWTNPHIWIELTVSEQGKSVTYSIEGSSPGSLSRRGWSRKTFKVGDKVSVVMNPLKNGEPGGTFVRATGATGAVIDH